MRTGAAVRDVRFGLIEATEAEAAYGVVLSVGGEVDTAETARRRAALAANTPMS
mgnify:CR=1 FL=1